MNKQPSLIKIITIDYPAFSAFLFPIIAWGLYLVLVIMGNVKSSDIVLPAIYAIITLVSIGVISWRVHLINTIFNDGQETPATISSVYFFRDRGRVEYVYKFQGQKHTSSNAVHKVKRTRALRIGDKVTVMVDRSDPKRAFIRDLYL